MQSSKPIISVEVYLRGEAVPCTLPAERGLALIDYLTKQTAPTHVKLTDRTGDFLVVRTSDIVRVVPRRQALTQQEVITEIRKATKKYV